MRIIIAPAKKMNTDPDSFAPEGPPQFLNRTERLKAALQAMSPEELQKLRGSGLPVLPRPLR